MTAAFVLDTNALLHYASGNPKKLGRATRRAFDRYERGEATLYVPAVVVIETWMLARRGTIQLKGTLEGWWRSVSSPGLVQVELTAEDVWVAAGLDWDHPDLFDRLIVASALRLDCPLLTKDGEITDWGGVETAW